jgi:hypothetical protein
MMHGRLPGFEVFRDDNNNQLVKTVINKDLTKQLGRCSIWEPIITVSLIYCIGKVTAPLTEETSLALADLLGEDTGIHMM